MKAYELFNKAMVEVTDANPSEIKQSKQVVVKDTHGRPKATFKNFNESLEIANKISSELDFIEVKETAAAYEITVKE